MPVREYTEPAARGSLASTFTCAHIHDDDLERVLSPLFVNELFGATMRELCTNVHMSMTYTPTNLIKMWRSSCSVEQASCGT